MVARSLSKRESQADVCEQGYQDNNPSYLSHSAIQDLGKYFMTAVWSIYEPLYHGMPVCSVGVHWWRSCLELDKARRLS